VGWLLLVPVLVVMLVQPAALGSYAAASRSTVPGGGHEGGFEPLAAPVRGAVPMSMAEFVTRRSATPTSRWPGSGCGWSGSSPPARAGKAATG
jgi:hypothetical protein